MRNSLRHGPSWNGLGRTGSSKWDGSAAITVGFMIAPALRICFSLLLRLVQSSIQASSFLLALQLFHMLRPAHGSFFDADPKHGLHGVDSIVASVVELPTDDVELGQDLA
jgi:hypothetical protein